MPDEQQQTPVADLSYEQARDELVRIVARIEGGAAPLEESMLLWERGEKLAAHCQAKLDQAQSRLDAHTQPSSAAEGDQLQAEGDQPLAEGDQPHVGLEQAEQAQAEGDRA